MIYILFALLVIVLIFIVKFFILQKKVNQLINHSNSPVAEIDTHLYHYLLKYLDREKMQIEKHKEAIMLEDEVKRNKHNPLRLKELKPEVELLHGCTVPKLAEYHFYSAKEYYKKRQFEKAIVLYTKAINLVKDSMYYNDRGCAYHSINNLTLAINDYTQAMILNPNNGEYYFNRAAIYHEMQDKEKARKDWQRAFDLGIKEAEQPLRLFY